MSLTPFEIRLELLKMSKDMLTEEYYGKKEQLSNDWHMKVETARHAGIAPPEHPPIPAYPTESDVIKKAAELNGFVSQIPQDNKTSKKS
jgi:hypothetical protein